MIQVWHVEVVLDRVLQVSQRLKLDHDSMPGSFAKILTIPMKFPYF